MPMRYFVFVRDDVVVQTLHSSRAPGDGPGLPVGCVETDEATCLQVSSVPGYRYEDGRFVAPVVPRAAVVDLRSFFRLFTRDEVLAIASRRATDPDIEFFWTLLTLGQTVDLGHADTASGLDMLVSKQLITTERRAAVLANESPVVR